MNINELGMKPETLQRRLYMSAVLSLGDLMWGNRKPERRKLRTGSRKICRNLWKTSGKFVGRNRGSGQGVGCVVKAHVGRKTPARLPVEWQVSPPSAHRFGPDWFAWDGRGNAR